MVCILSKCHQSFRILVNLVRLNSNYKEIKTHSTRKSLSLIETASTPRVFSDVILNSLRNSGLQ